MLDHLADGRCHLAGLVDPQRLNAEAAGQVGEADRRPGEVEAVRLPAWRDAVVKQEVLV